ncbi:MAG: hypothetical protein HY786_06470, partial [Deltaproteobacteria bacterium]|nr:hypothetical protein [Deltaproteobacteria bacterium]
MTLAINQSDFAAAKKDIQIPVAVNRPKLNYSVRLMSKNGGNSLEQGEQAVLEVQVVNNGSLTAEGVKLSLVSNDENLQLMGQKEFMIGTIPPRTSGDLVKTQIVAKRRLSVGEAKLGVNVTQNEFGAVNQLYALNIIEEGATVIDIAGENRPKTAVAASS